MDQPSFEGLELRRTVAHSVFFMLRPDDAANAAVDRGLPRWREAHDLRGKTTAAGRRHVSVMGLGRRDGLPGGVLDTTRALAARVAAAPFEVRFDRIARFNGDSVVLLGSDGNPAVRRLAHILREAMRGLLPLPPPDFEPHMTLLYDPAARLPAHPVETISWTARHFELVESVPGALRHVELGSWDLRADATAAPIPGDAKPPVSAQLSLWDVGDVSSVASGRH